MSRTSYGFDYNDYEQRCNTFVDKLTTFLGQPENFNRLKEIKNSEGLRQLLTEAVKVAFPNPYNKT